MPTKNYDIGKLLFTVGTTNIGGYGEEGGVVLEWTNNAFEITEGANGDVTASKNRKSSARVTVTLLHNTKGAAGMGAMMLEQHRTTDDELPDVPFFLKEPSSGDEVSTQTCIFETRPGMEFNATPGEREFVLFLPGAAEKLRLGDNVTI